MAKKKCKYFSILAFNYLYYKYKKMSFFYEEGVVCYQKRSILPSFSTKIRAF